MSEASHIFHCIHLGDAACGGDGNEGRYNGPTLALEYLCLQCVADRAHY